jgi:hypothetical protein
MYWTLIFTTSNIVNARRNYTSGAPKRILGFCCGQWCSYFIVHLKWWNNNWLQSSVRSKMQQLSDMVNIIVNQTNTWKKNKKRGYCSLCWYLWNYLASLFTISFHKKINNERGKTYIKMSTMNILSATKHLM